METTNQTQPKFLGASWLAWFASTGALWITLELPHQGKASPQRSCVCSSGFLGHGDVCCPALINKQAQHKSPEVDQMEEAGSGCCSHHAQSGSSLMDLSLQCKVHPFTWGIFLASHQPSSWKNELWVPVSGWQQRTDLQSPDPRNCLYQETNKTSYSSYWVFPFLFLSLLASSAGEWICVFLRVMQYGEFLKGPNKVQCLTHTDCQLHEPSSSFVKDCWGHLQVEAVMTNAQHKRQGKVCPKMSKGGRWDPCQLQLFMVVVL